MAAKKVVVLVDGTWCGPETNTKSNIYYLAKMIGIDPDAENPTYTSGHVHARYFIGSGLGGDFMSYLWDGALATHAAEECSKVYEYIVQNYNLNDEIWMFGLSRGAYVVRSVAGMINNCGIVRFKENEALIKQVYGLYRSKSPVNAPGTDQMKNFRARVSHQVTTPIKFMGLFDTVGSRGIPRLNYDSGKGFEWPEFHDTMVSSTVEKVYHAMSTHDRLWAFQPCPALRDPTKHAGSTTLKIYQRWFPGCHYDLGRQEFQFFREGKKGFEGLAASLINLFSRTISPNDQLADLVLLWILDGVTTEGGDAIIQRNVQGQRSTMAEIKRHLRTSLYRRSTGVGDMYGDIHRYLPFANLLGIPLTVIRLVNSTLYSVLFSPQDRVIPDPGADPLVENSVYNYTVPDPSLVGNNGHTVVVGTTAGVVRGAGQDPRYPSTTFQNYVTYMNATGQTP